MIFHNASASLRSLLFLALLTIVRIELRVLLTFTLFTESIPRLTDQFGLSPVGLQHPGCNFKLTLSTWEHTQTSY